MTEKVLAMPAGRLAITRISYFCDLRRNSGLVIPLGVIAEITLGQVHVLGLIARTELRENEISAVGRSIRHKLEEPFDFLETEFDWAWENTAPGEALPTLVRRHTDSLFFAAPRIEEVRKAIEFDADAAAEEFAKEELRRKRDEEFRALLIDTWHQREVVPNRDAAISALAA